MSNVYQEWESQSDIDLSQYEEQTEKFWNGLLPFQKYNFFPWATGFNGGTLREMIMKPEYNQYKFDELDDDIKEEIVEKYAVQKGLVKAPEDTDLPDWTLLPVGVELN